MRKYTLTLLFLPTILFGQSFEKIITKSDTFFVLKNLNLDSIPKSLPDGKWKVYFDNDTSKPRYIFNLKNNSVNGHFESYYKNGNLASIGTYLNDSLWSFRSDDFAQRDTTFKYALWRYYAAGFMQEESHKIPFSDNDSIFKDHWFHRNGQLLMERVHHNRIGLLKASWYYEDGRRLRLYENYSTSNIYISLDENGKIASLNLNNGFNYNLSLDSNRIYMCKGCTTVQTIYDQNNEHILTLAIDKSGNVRYMSGKDFHVSYDGNGQLERISYKDKRNRRRTKKFK